MQRTHAPETLDQSPGNFLAERFLSLLDRLTPMYHFHQLLCAERDRYTDHDDADLDGNLTKAVKRLWPMDVHRPPRLGGGGRAVDV